jgi:cytochrome c
MKYTVTAALAAASLLAAAPALAADSAELALAKKSNCMACHTVAKKLVGPAYQDVAKKYAGDKNAAAKLFDRVKKGTAATGGEVWKMGSAMPANGSVKDDDVKKLVAWILAGAK